MPSRLGWPLRSGYWRRDWIGTVVDGAMAANSLLHFRLSDGPVQRFGGFSGMQTWQRAIA
ncbi:MAG: hypothetical protein ABI164_08800 [Acidobacteriaceae bacterium]